MREIMVYKSAQKHRSRCPFVVWPNTEGGFNPLTPSFHPTMEAAIASIETVAKGLGWEAGSYSVEKR